MAKVERQTKVFICAGTGGVGKTTISAALGLRLARLGYKVLVLTIDPAKRLAGALGLGESLARPVQVLVPGVRGEMWAEMIDPGKVFEEFITRSAPDPDSAKRLNSNRLFRQLATTLSGSQEFTAQERLLVAAESGQFDMVILDTPPSQHAIDFLRAPERVFSLFQESVTRWFVERKSSGLVQQVLQRGTKTALSALEKITGNEFLHELADFFSNVAAVQSTVAQRSIAVHRLLSGEQTQFILITAFDDAKMKEAMEFSQDMKNTGHSLRCVIVNRCLPQWLAGDGHWRGLAAGDETLTQLIDFHEKYLQYFAERSQMQDAFLKRTHDSAEVLRIPDLQDDPLGLEGLSLVAEYLPWSKEKK